MTQYLLTHFSSLASSESVSNCSFSNSPSACYLKVLNVVFFSLDLIHPPDWERYKSLALPSRLSMIWLWNVNVNFFLPHLRFPLKFFPLWIVFLVPGTLHFQASIPLSLFFTLPRTPTCFFMYVHLFLFETLLKCRFFQVATKHLPLTCRNWNTISYFCCSDYFQLVQKWHTLLHHSKLFYRYWYKCPDVEWSLSEVLRFCNSFHAKCCKDSKPTDIICPPTHYVIWLTSYAATLCPLGPLHWAQDERARFGVSIYWKILSISINISIVSAKLGISHFIWNEDHSFYCRREYYSYTQ